MAFARIFAAKPHSERSKLLHSSKVHTSLFNGECKQLNYNGIFPEAEKALSEFKAGSKTAVALCKTISGDTIDNIKSNIKYMKDNKDNPEYIKRINQLIEESR